MRVHHLKDPLIYIQISFFLYLLSNHHGVIDIQLIIKVLLLFFLLVKVIMLLRYVALALGYYVQHHALRHAVCSIYQVNKA